MREPRPSQDQHAGGGHRAVEDRRGRLDDDAVRRLARAQVAECVGVGGVGPRVQRLGGDRAHEDRHPGDRQQQARSAPVPAAPPRPVGPFGGLHVAGGPIGRRRHGGHALLPPVPCPRASRNEAVSPRPGRGRADGPDPGDLRPQRRRPAPSPCRRGLRRRRDRPIHASAPAVATRAVARSVGQPRTPGRCEVQQQGRRRQPGQRGGNPSSAAAAEDRAASAEASSAPAPGRGQGTAGSRCLRAETRTPMAKASIASWKPGTAICWKPLSRPL